MILKTVTLQEANGLLPLVKERFLRVSILLSLLYRKQRILNKNHGRKLLIDKDASLITIIHKKPSRKKRRKTKAEIKGIERTLGKEFITLFELGAVVRSIFPPHIDFLSTRNYELVYLCWHGGDDEICHWHYVEENHPMRKSIPIDNDLFGRQVVH